MPATSPTSASLEGTRALLQLSPCPPHVASQLSPTAPAYHSAAGVGVIEGVAPELMDEVGVPVCVRVRLVVPVLERVLVLLRVMLALPVGLPAQQNLMIQVKS